MATSGSMPPRRIPPQHIITPEPIDLRLRRVRAQVWQLLRLVMEEAVTDPFVGRLEARPAWCGCGQVYFMPFRMMRRFLYHAEMLVQVAGECRHRVVSLATRRPTVDRQHGTDRQGWNVLMHQVRIFGRRQRRRRV